MTLLLVEGSRASRDFYAVAAQILPVLLLVLALERNYFFRAPPPAPGGAEWPRWAARYTIGEKLHQLNRRLEPKLDWMSHRGRIVDRSIGYQSWTSRAFAVED